MLQHRCTSALGLCDVRVCTRYALRWLRRCGGAAEDGVVSVQPNRTRCTPRPYMPCLRLASFAEMLYRKRMLQRHRRTKRSLQCRAVSQLPTDVACHSSNLSSRLPRNESPERSTLNLALIQNSWSPSSPNALARSVYVPW